MADLFIGTCSWKYDSWRGIIYSDNKDINYLQEYSRSFNSVEIDQWFWSLFGKDKISLPLPKVVEEYARSVPDNFKFSIKVPNSITLTHFYRKSKSDPLKENPHFFSPEIFSKFIDLLRPIHDKIGIIMFQFEYLNKQKMQSQSIFQQLFSDFFSKCDRNFDYAVEIRNPNYLNRSYFNFLKENQIGHVFLQGYYMPPIFDIYNKFETDISYKSVIRLHGPDRSGIEEKSVGLWNKIIEPKDDDISKVTKIIEKLNSRNLDVYVNVNNHFEGSAPLTIEKLRNLINLHSG